MWLTRSFKSHISVQLTTQEKIVRENSTNDCLIQKNSFNFTAGALQDSIGAQYSQSKSNPGLSGHDELPAPSVDTMHAPCDLLLWLYQEPFVIKEEKKMTLVRTNNSTHNTNHATVHTL